MKLDNIIMDYTFNGVLVKMSDNYNPLTVDNNKPFNNTHALHDYSLMVAEQTTNMYVFKPYSGAITSICLHKDEIKNVLNNIEKVYLRPLYFTEEMAGSMFVTLYLLNIPVDELYESIIPSKYKPKSHDLLKQLIIQATRDTIIQDEVKHNSVFIINNENFGFHYKSPSIIRDMVWRYIIESVLPSVKELFGYSTINNLKELFQEGYYGVYPEFRVEDNTINIKVHTVAVSNPDDEKTFSVTISMDKLEYNKSIDMIYNPHYSYIAFTGNVLNFFKKDDDKFIHLIYDLLKRKGRLITIIEGSETIIEKVKDVVMTVDSLYIDSDEYKMKDKVSVIKTSQYYLTKESVIEKLFVDGTLEKAKKLFNNYIRKNGYFYSYDHHIVNSELFGVVMI